MEPILYVAMVLGVAAVLASMVSVELGISVAIIEILAGVGLGNTLHLATQDWLVFLASLGTVVLTFNAGAEIDPAQLRRTWRASLLIGSASFAAPFTVVLLLCRYALGWSWQAAEIGGIALSTTSVAVIWAVAVETGASPHRAPGSCSSPPRSSGTLAACSHCPVLFVTPPGGWCRSSPCPSL